MTPYKIDVPQVELDELKRRLAATRWPERETVMDWSQGAPLERVQALCVYWRDHYDWRRCEAKLNSYDQLMTSIDGLSFHVMHIRSSEPNALPMLMTHGWPGSIMEFLPIIGPLTNPLAYGGKAEDAFHLILPSLPGYGFSERPSTPGWGCERIARAWITLMDQLGYRRWVAQGGDWGANVTAPLALMSPTGCAGIHLSTMFLPPEPADPLWPSKQEAIAIAKLKHFNDIESAYFRLQATRPQTLGYGLSDSPAGLAAWLYEKINNWSDHDGPVEALFSMDQMLDNIMMYWLSNTATSSARLYWESGDNTALPIKIPVGVSVFWNDPNVAPRAWAERFYENIVYWNDVEKGGHFAAWEQPDIFVSEMRACFQHMR